MTSQASSAALPIKGILFDNDGTLVDTHDLILASMRHATAEVFGAPLPDEKLMEKVGQPLVVQVQSFTSDPCEQEEFLQSYQAHNLSRHDDALKAFPGIVDALAQLHARGIKMGVVTSKKHALAQRGLEIVGLAPYLDCCIGADDCTRYKPDPQPVQLGLEALGLAPKECLYVGDSPFDLQAGRGAGCRVVAVTWGMFGANVLAAELPDFIIDDPRALVELANPMLSTFDF